MKPNEVYKTLVAKQIEVHETVEEKKPNEVYETLAAKLDEVYETLGNNKKWRVK